MAQIERSRFGHYLALVVIVAAVLVYLTPIYWIVATSLKSPSDIIARVPQFLFQVTLEHYQKLMPPEVPGLTYVFIAEALIGMLACLLPFRDIAFARRCVLVWNGVLILTYLYALVTTINYNFLMLAIYTVVVFLLTSPPKDNRCETHSSVPHRCRCLSNCCRLHVVCTRRVEILPPTTEQHHHRVRQHPPRCWIWHTVCLCVLALQGCRQGGSALLHPQHTDAASRRRRHPNLLDV